MSSAVFSTGNESYQISKIIHVGSVTPIPEKIKKDNGCTHSFKLVTPQSAVYCYYRSEDTAKNARGALGAMLREAKPALFSSGYELVDPSRVISFGNVFAFKKPTADGNSHAFVVTIDTSDERHRKVWLRYKSEESAKKARRAMFAAVHAGIHGSSTDSAKSDGADPSAYKQAPTAVAA
ncbi:MAG: hypothetical protein GF344_05495 [Chitinivibrionales bacterium]|nr:hypothetical protein [Chitinivibrionales bacterium]MBD3356425.1 hypothetical protein [Chitinivibrionales bacterium]